MNNNRKVLILCAHRPGRSPSQRYRFEQYLPFLESKGFSFRFSGLLDEKSDRIFYSRGNTFRKVFLLIKMFLKRFGDLRQFKEYDIIFIQREAIFTGTSFFERAAFRSGAKVIFDFDDSIWLPDTSPGNKKWEWIKRPAKFFANLRNAHLVIAGNSYLAEKARPFNADVIVIPTTIDTGLHRPEPALRSGERVVVGWSGSISTFKHLQSLFPVLLSLSKKYGDRVAFKMMGAGKNKNADPDIESLEWTPGSEVASLNSFDIGIMPLPDDEWAQGKCGLKALSYMACGLPVVLSPVGMNKDIVVNGENGFFASDDDEWFNSLSVLIEDPALRTRMGEQGRKKVIEEYSVSKWKEAYLNAFRNLAAPVRKDPY